MSLYSEAIEFIQEAIAPSACVGCGRGRFWLCPDCANELIYVKEQVCPRCKRLMLKGKTCPRCRRHLDLDGLIVVLHYDDGATRELVHRLKYDGMTALVEVLGPMLIATWGKQELQCDIITAVPLHPSKLNQRGFNQAELLAQAVAAGTGLKYLSGLVRVRKTISQAGLDRVERQSNLYRAFKASRNMRDLSCLVVDDVATTGATLEDAARALKDAGAKRVWGLVVARG